MLTAVSPVWQEMAAYKSGIASNVVEEEDEEDGEEEEEEDGE